VENLDVLNVGWLGVFITPTTKLAVWWRLLSHGAPDTVWCASHVTWPLGSDRWVPTVGALSCGPAWLSSGAPDKPCRLSGVPPARALTSARAGAHSMRLQSTVGAK
jgi:hypothetical protein